MKHANLIALFIVTHVGFILLHIYKEALFVNASYTNQKYTNELKSMQDEQNRIRTELFMVQNPTHIAAYAQEKLALAPLKLKQIGILS